MQDVHWCRQPCEAAFRTPAQVLQMQQHSSQMCQVGCCCPGECDAVFVLYTPLTLLAVEHVSSLLAFSWYAIVAIATEVVSAMPSGLRAFTSTTTRAMHMLTGATMPVISSPRSSKTLRVRILTFYCLLVDFQVVEQVS